MQNLTSAYQHQNIGTTAAIMTSNPSYQEQFDALQACVLIPTYNNEQTLSKVLLEVGGYTRNIIVVNDGSTDGTPDVLKNFPTVKSLSYHPNKGKGWALRQGFEIARREGYHYAISIDSDGQHFASDLPRFLEKARECPHAIIIGARNMDQASVPGKSSFGHKFSNFWFKVETGISLH